MITQETIKNGYVPWNKGRTGLQIGWNKGLKMSKEYCDRCRTFMLGPGNPRRGAKLSALTKKKMSIAHIGNKAYNWKGDKNLTYWDIHGRLYRYFGSPQICENPKCSGRSNRFDWALKHNHAYSVKRKDYKRLCRPCHMRYDKITKRGWVTRKINKK